MIISIKAIDMYNYSIHLFRWRFIVHGGIDGYSHMIVYLQCATNNRGSTVFDCFIDAIQNYGLPSRVRSDRGGENVQIANFMLQHPDQGRIFHHWS